MAVTVREHLEEIERRVLEPGACLAAGSQGRLRPEPESDARTCFMRDRDRIIHSKAFRRLKHKTQVFLSPEGDHYRTRLTHTLEVSQISRTIARGLGLNEDLTEAIALGHDLGHTAFGHAGERALDEAFPAGFRHNQQSLRVVDRLENGGAGLNLTFEVRDGILCHSGSQRAQTKEGRIVHFADRIAYINHDIDDAIRAGILHQSDLPRGVTRLLGETHSRRINTLVEAMLRYGRQTGEVGLEEETEAAMLELRDFMLFEPGGQRGGIQRPGHFAAALLLFCGARRRSAPGLYADRHGGKRRAGRLRLCGGHDRPVRRGYVYPPVHSTGVEQSLMQNRKGRTPIAVAG